MKTIQIFDADDGMLWVMYNWIETKNNKRGDPIDLTEEQFWKLEDAVRADVHTILEWFLNWINLLEDHE